MEARQHALTLRRRRKDPAHDTIEMVKIAQPALDDGEQLATLFRLEALRLGRVKGGERLYNFTFPDRLDDDTRPIVHHLDVCEHLHDAPKPSRIGDAGKDEQLLAAAAKHGQRYELLINVLVLSDTSFIQPNGR